MADVPNPVDDPVKQLTPIAWFDAGVIKGLLSALALLAGTIGTIFFGIDETQFNATAEKLITALVAFLVVAAPIAYAIWSRFRQPTPPLASSRTAAAEKTEAMQASGALPPEVKS
jgi:hypothetical protein